MGEAWSVLTHNMRSISLCTNDFHDLPVTHPLLNLLKFRQGDDRRRVQFFQLLQSLLLQGNRLGHFRRYFYPLVMEASQVDQSDSAENDSGGNEQKGGNNSPVHV